MVSVQEAGMDASVPGEEDGGGLRKPLPGMEKEGRRSFPGKLFADIHMNISIMQTKDECTHVMVGCTKSTCPFNSAGIEYASVRTVSMPVSALWNVVNSVPRREFACSTVAVADIQSPAGEMVLGVRPAEVSQELTRAIDSAEGFTYSST